jgi:archaemetzincin
VILRVQPMGDIARSSVEEAAGSARNHFGFEIEVADPVPALDAAWDARRLQFQSVLFMRALAAMPSNGAVRVLGITACDLFIPALTFVFGQAQLDGVLSLVSVARLRQGFYGLPEDPELFRVRTRKEVAHELGHTLGLTHCSNRECAMSLSTTIYQVDAKHDRFCEACRHQIDRRLGALELGKP